MCAIQLSAAANWAWLILILNVSKLALLEVSGFYHLAVFCFSCNSPSLKPAQAAAQGDARDSQANTLLHHFHEYCGEPVCFFRHRKTFPMVFGFYL